MPYYKLALLVCAKCIQIKLCGGPFECTIDLIQEFTDNNVNVFIEQRVNLWKSSCRLLILQECYRDIFLEWKKRFLTAYPNVPMETLDITNCLHPEHSFNLYIRSRPKWELITIWAMLKFIGMAANSNHLDRKWYGHFMPKRGALRRLHLICCFIFIYGIFNDIISPTV
jgi:hypothetical protein